MSINLRGEKILKIYLSEQDRHEGRPLYEFIALKARESGISGVTVLNGIMGFGSHYRVHTVKIMELSHNMPVVIEIVDSAEKISAFTDFLSGVMKKGIATIDDVCVMRFGAEK